MKIIISTILFFSLCVNSFCEENFPNKQMFSVTAEDGTIFELESDISTVYKKFGEPLRKENIWACYPDANCEFYIIEYEGISFCYYSIDNKIVRIIITNKKYKITDNNISIGSSYNDVIKYYKKPHKESKFYNKEKGIDEIQATYTTEGTRLFYIKQTVQYYYGASFNFDIQNKNCNQIILNFYMVY